MSAESPRLQIPTKLFYPSRASTSISEFTTSVTKVALLLSKIHTSKSTLPECIPARILRLAPEELAPYVNRVFELSLESGELPRSWKDAVVIPVYKKGSRSNPGNYRPISLLSATSKVLDKIVCKQVLQQVERYLPDKQSGFRKADGTVPQLTRLLHTIYQALDNGKNVLAVFYCLSKAFDRVWHRGLLAKIEHLGVTGKALNWIEGYLLDRRPKSTAGRSTFILTRHSCRRPPGFYSWTALLSNLHPRPSRCCPR